MAKRRRSRGIKAWLITREMIGNRPLEEDEVVAILSPRLSERYIKALTQLFHDQQYLTPSERIERIGRSSGDDAEGTGFGHFYCGHNPMVHARKVMNLRVDHPDDATGEGKPLWDEIEIPQSWIDVREKIRAQNRAADG